MIQRKTSRGGATAGTSDDTAPSVGKRALTSQYTRSSMAPLPTPIAEDMGASLGADVSGVEVGTDPSVGAMGARAVAEGEQIRFAPSAWDPGSSGGQHLIAHELTHVVQQRDGRVAPMASPAGGPLSSALVVDAGLEAEADAVASRVVAGERVGLSAGGGAATPGRVQADGLAPGAAATAAAAPVPPALLGHAGQVVSDGGGFRYTLRGDAIFVVTLAPPAYASVVGREIGPTGRYAAAWQQLCQQVLSTPAPAAAPTPASGAEAAAPASDAGGGLLSEVGAGLSAIGGAIAGGVAAVTGTLASIGASLFADLVGTPAPDAGAAPAAPGTDTGAAPDTGATDGGTGPAPGSQGIVIRPGAYLHVEASSSSKSLHVTTAVPVEVVETKVDDATIKNGNGASEAGKSEWTHVRSADAAIDHWGQFSSFARADELAGDLAAKDQIPLDKLTGDDLKVATIWNQKGAYIDSARGSLERAIGVAVMAVESGGGATTATGTPVVRFEVHKFFRNNEGLSVGWGHANQATFDDHFRPETGAAGHELNEAGAKAGGEWTAFHGSQTEEWKAIDLATSLADRETALRCISMGAGQVMGFNAKQLGYQSAAAMFDAMNGDVRKNIGGIFDFIAAQPTAQAALAAEDFTTFAVCYNGAGPWAATYGGNIARYVAAFRKHAATHLEHLTAGAGT